MNPDSLRQRVMNAMASAAHLDGAGIPGMADEAIRVVTEAIADDHAYWAGAVVVDSDYWLGVKHGVEDCATRIRSIKGDQQ